jgi:hypothetical protein
VLAASMKEVKFESLSSVTLGLAIGKVLLVFEKEKGSAEHCPELDAKRGQCHDRRGDAENEIGITGFAIGNIG